MVPAPSSTKKLLVANWKMSVLLKDAIQLLSSVDTQDCARELVVCPSFVHIKALRDFFPGLLFGAQDCSAYDIGAYTGDVSISMLSEVGCSYVIIGHSERRTLYGESDNTISSKIALAFNAGIKPILCIGEPMTVKEDGETLEYLFRQLSVLPEHYMDCIVAYEPIWAIGSGVIPTIHEIGEILDAIRLRYPGLKLMYGGSVDPVNADLLYKLENIDGLLVGGASTNSVKLQQLISSNFNLF